MRAINILILHVQKLGGGVGFHARWQCRGIRRQPRQPARPRRRRCIRRHLLGSEALQDGDGLHAGPPLRRNQGHVELPLEPAHRQWKGSRSSKSDRSFCRLSINRWIHVVRIRTIGWDRRVIVTGAPSLFPSTPIKPAGMVGCVSTDGDRSSEEILDFELLSCCCFKMIDCLCCKTQMSLKAGISLQEHGHFPQRRQRTASYQLVGQPW